MFIFNHNKIIHIIFNIERDNYISARIKNERKLHIILKEYMCCYCCYLHESTISVIHHLRPKKIMLNFTHA